MTGRVTRADGAVEVLAPWRSATLAPGDILAVGRVEAGVAILALSGGVTVPPVLGSRATYARAGLGGVSGRPVQSGDPLPCGAAGRATVSAEDVERAIAEDERRSGRVRDRVLDEIRKGTFLIDTRGAKVGQVNGLSVLSLGRSSFGRPSRITARARLGKGARAGNRVPKLLKVQRQPAQRVFVVLDQEDPQRSGVIRLTHAFPPACGVEV